MDGFIPDELFVAVAPLAGPLGAAPVGTGVPEDCAGIWSAADSGAADPTAGGQFEDYSVFTAVDWDGASVLDPAGGLTDKTGLSSLSPGDHALRGAVLVDQLGWILDLDHSEEPTGGDSGLAATP